MKIKILDRAEYDILDGFQFYEAQQNGLGAYFLDEIYSDIESLRLYAGIHLKPHKDYHRLLSKKFPFAVFYTLSNETVFIHAIVDCRRDPDRIRAKLQ